MDPIKLEIYKSLFNALCEEMGEVLKRASFSPNIKERKDFSCALFNSKAELIAQAAHIPIHLGSMGLAVSESIPFLKNNKDPIQSGDVIITNDPFNGGTHLPDPTKAYLVKISHDEWRRSSVAQTLPSSLVELDVSVLHRLILEEILGISEEAQAKQENVIYWKDTTRAIDETRKGKCQVTFLMNPTRIEHMEKVALSGEKMPQKSTFFYPKILSGLVINPLDGTI